eukprot:scaffold1906_cov34-Tisochrysis_lutea.AAC.2
MRRGCEELGTVWHRTHYAIIPAIGRHNGCKSRVCVGESNTPISRAHAHVFYKILASDQDWEQRYRMAYAMILSNSLVLTERFCPRHPPNLSYSGSAR